MAVRVRNVKRVDEKATGVSVLIGGIEVRFIQTKRGPREVARLRHDVGGLTRDSLYIPPADYRELCRTVYKIFGEKRQPRKART